MFIVCQPQWFKLDVRAIPPVYIHMLSKIFLILFGVNLVVASSSRPRDFDVTDISKGLKQVRFVENETESDLLKGMQSMNLFDYTEMIKDPLLVILNEKIPSLKLRELEAMLDEAISNENLNLIKLLNSHGKLSLVFTDEHIEQLCKSPTDVSMQILDYIFALSWFDFELYETDLFVLLSYCIPTSFNKLKSFWLALGGDNLPDESKAELLFRVSYKRFSRFYEFIYDRISHLQSSRSIMEKTLNLALAKNNIESLLFLLENEASLSHLNVYGKVKALSLFSTSNNATQVRYLLNDNTVRSAIKQNQSNPWLKAVKHDFPEVVEAYLQAIPEIYVKNLAMLAFTTKRMRVLEHFKAKGVLDSEVIFDMALHSVRRGDTNSIKLAINLGLDLAKVDCSGKNLLAIAVEMNQLAVVECLIKFGGMNPNILIEIVDLYETISLTPTIYLAKSPQMVYLLNLEGANINAPYKMFSADGTTVTFSETALVKSIRENNQEMINALVDNGATTLSDN